MYRSLIPDDLRYFHDHFVCKKMIDDWSEPPVRIDGKRKPIADFTSWTLGSPIVSDKAHRLILELCGEDVEFLPFNVFRRNSFAMNVLACGNYVDTQESVLRPFPISIVFKKEVPEFPPIFKSSGVEELVFVTERFAKLVVTHGLTGIELLDPTENALFSSITGVVRNSYPGTPT